jgi:hypothetical protein
MDRFGNKAIPGISGVGLALNIRPWIPSLRPELYVNDDLAIAHFGISFSKPRSLNRGMRRVPPDGNPVAWHSRPLKGRVGTG